MWLVFLGAVATIELARQLPLLAAFRRLARSSGRATRVVAARGSDRWKERAMRGASAHLLVASLRAGALLLVVAAPLVIVIAAIVLLRLPAAEQLFDWSARARLALLCLVYALVRFQLGRLRRR